MFPVALHITLFGAFRTSRYTFHKDLCHLYRFRCVASSAISGTIERQKLIHHIEKFPTSACVVDMFQMHLFDQSLNRTAKVFGDLQKKYLKTSLLIHPDKNPGETTNVPMCAFDRLGLCLKNLATSERANVSCFVQNDAVVVPLTLLFIFRTEEKSDDLGVGCAEHDSRWMRWAPGGRSDPSVQFGTGRE